MVPPTTDMSEESNPNTCVPNEKRRFADWPAVKDVVGFDRQDPTEKSVVLQGVTAPGLAVSTVTEIPEDSDIVPAREAMAVMILAVFE